jgi:EmrB/QacA subfamily drug resistance transporter
MLAVLCLSLVIVVVGNTTLNVAIPTLVRDLGATPSQLQWIVDSYALVFAGLLLFSGAVGDRFGRRRILTLGLAVFGGASAWSAFVDTPDALIVTRAVMGLGAALIMPATLAILVAVFPAAERPRAIAIWAGLAGAGGAIGPPLSGLFLEWFWWGSVFLINLPLVALALGSGAWLLPRVDVRQRTPLDTVGAALSVLTLSAILFAIIEAPVVGATAPSVVVSIMAAVVGLAAFVVWELRVDHPMLDLRSFRDARFTSATVTITLVFFALFGMFFLLTQFLQLVLGYGTLATGLSGLPVAVGLMLAAPRSAHLAQRFGSKRVVVVGLLTVSIALVAMSWFSPDTAYPYIGVVLFVLALGMGLTTAPTTTWIMTSLPLDKAGVGSAVNDATRELGGALGVAVLGSLAAWRYADAAPRSASLGELVASGVASSETLAVGRAAFVEGLSLAVLAAAAVSAVAALLVFVWARDDRPARQLEDTMAESGLPVGSEA